ncbi:MAG: polynucleotide phosphorylase [Candidatus Westeberhardia cardiocondylae]|nr:polynucleotide phosphorylase [Candidatus Westeberhardia cardiocondylae]
MLSSVAKKFKYGKHNIIIETGMIAKQASSSVLVNMDDTVVLVTVVGDKKIKPGQLFFPLIVNYQERTYAAGRFPGGFFRREGRPSENEILISRLIDRPIRPLFPKNFFYEVQIVATVMSINPQVNPDIVAIIGSSAALSLSDIPFYGPIGASRVGYINNKYVLNPTVNDLKESELDLIISGTCDSVLMVESESKLLNEDQIFGAIVYGQEKQKIIIEQINELVSKVGKTKWIWNTYENYDDIKTKIFKLAKFKLEKAYKISNKDKRYTTIESIKMYVKDILCREGNNCDENIFHNFFNDLEKSIFRKRILNGEPRLDGRKSNMIRNVDMNVGIFPRTHGSSIFTKGETQVLVIVTLGTERDAQNIDSLIGDRIDRFLFHYNFPSYCVGEIGMVGPPKRREIGHGKLIKKSILPVMPSLEDFPYTVRVVSEITESNGSSSMASVCGASLALMDAGVPIKTSVAGVAMGLVKDGNRFEILSDILGNEDHFGDMDFKISGSKIGITALQMDIKILDINYDIVRMSLLKARVALLSIIDDMEKVIKYPKRDISKFAPRIYLMKINPDKIRDVIGKGGSIVRSLTEETGTVIEIKEDGIIKIAAIDVEKAKYVIRRIEDIVTTKIEVDRIYNGKVTRIVHFGAFVSIIGGKEGLVHISQISDQHVKKVDDYLKLGQKVSVKVLEIDNQGRVRLSIKKANNIKF